MSRPDVTLTSPDLDAVETAIRSAVDDRRPDRLDLIGNGEFSIAVRWQADGTNWVVKRVPPFRSRATADAYIDLTREYIDALRSHGVRCVTTDLLTLDRPDGRSVVYHVQPLLDVDQLADHRLKAAGPDDHDPTAEAVVDAVIDAIVRVVGDGVAFDAQFANWYWYEGEVWQLDFSTPLLLDDAGKIRFDPWGFLQEYPMVVRPLVYRELMKLAPHYLDTVYVLTDLMAQLHRQDMSPWCDVVARIAADRHGIEVSPALAAERCREEAEFFPRLLRLKRFQRAWRQRTGRRYDSLLPAASTYET